jgi:hypothetical protein
MWSLNSTPPTSVVAQPARRARYLRWLDYGGCLFHGWQRFGAQGGADRDVAGGVVVVDLHAAGFVQSPLQRVGCAGQVERQLRQHVEQLGLLRLFPFGDDPELVRLGLLGPSLVLQVGEAGAEPFGPRAPDLLGVVDGLGFPLLHQVVLSPSQFRDRLPDRRDPVLVVLALVGALPGTRRGLGRGPAGRRTPARSRAGERLRTTNTKILNHDRWSTAADGRQAR